MDAIGPVTERQSGGGPAKSHQRVAVYGICEDLRGAGGRVLLVRAAPYLTVAGRWFLPGGGIDHGSTRNGPRFGRSARRRATNAQRSGRSVSRASNSETSRRHSPYALTRVVLVVV